MSNPLNFSFDGEYRRRPAQNLGGRRSTDTRQEVVRRAQAERYRRERDRKIATAIVVLQSYVRSYMVRKTLKNARRLEFDSNLRETYTTEELGNQLSKLNYFFDLSIDQQRFFDFCKVVIPNRRLILEKSTEDSIWLLRVRDLLRNSLKIRGANVYPVYIRLFEEFTDDSDTSETSFKRLTYLWVNMIGNAKFFASWLDHMESKCYALREVPQPPLYPIAAAFMIILKRPLNLIPKLSVSTQNFRLGKFVLSGQDVVNLIFEKFTESFAMNVMHHTDTKYYVVRGPPHNGIVTYLVQPYLIRDYFPYSEYIRFLGTKKYDDHPTSRNILFTLLFLSTPFNVQTNLTEFFQTIRSFLYCIDPANNIAAPPRYEEKEDLDWPEMVHDPVALNYQLHMDTIFEALKQMLNQIPVVEWLDSSFDQNWDILCPLISIMARYEKSDNLHVIQFLSVLAYRREFMRSLYSKVERARKTAKTEDEQKRGLEDLLVFCYLFTHLMSTLHDVEFIQTMPMSRWQLTEFVLHLKDVYADIIIHGKDDNKNDFMTAIRNEATNTLLLLYERNTRMTLFQEGTFLSNSLRAISPVQTHSLVFSDFSRDRIEDEPQLSSMDFKFLRILKQFPFCLSFHDRVSAWHRLLDLDRGQRFSHHGMREQIQIRRSHIYEDAYEKLSPDNVPDLRDNIRISLVNVVGAQEAGVDGGGLLREFLSEATRAGVDPNRGLFRLDSQNRIYPNPVAKKIDPNYFEHFFLMGRLVGKALYEQTLLELPLAAFFIQTCIVGKIECAVDYLATLDSGLHKNLLALKTYMGDWNALGLDFTITLEELGDMRTVELKKDGASIAVDKSNVIEYIHLVADYKINKEMEIECRYFRHGLFDVVPILKMFSWREMQTLVSGSDKAIDIDDWMKFTHYAGGYEDNHHTIKLFWQVLRGFDETHLRKLLKFVTSCSRPPILGFKDLVPNFGIQNAGISDRLPTAATCMNLLKLPEFTDIEVLRQKLIYAIDAQAGFELS